jgi:hypothetical protein
MNYCASLYIQRYLSYIFHMFFDQNLNSEKANVKAQSYFGGVSLKIGEKVVNA